MRRVLLTGALLCAAASAAVIATATGGAGDDARYEVAAIFDTANGVVTGSRVKIAGTPVGSVERVELVRGPKARIVMHVPGRFAPFHADARCSILPEGLIAEKYVSCDPGRATAGELARSARGVPTVPLTQTAIPLSLQEFLNVFAAPTPDRMRIMFNELGIATAGRGEDINALLRRSNPALAQARRVLGVLDRQRAQLADGTAQMDRVLGTLAAGKQDLRLFVDRAATVSETLAAHAKGLAESIRRFPPMLRELRPALRDLDRAAAAGRPALAGLRAAGPAFTDVTESVPRFLAVGRRAMPSVVAASRVGRQTMRETKPLINHLKSSAADTLPYVKALNPLLISIRDTGGIEAFWRQWYGIGVSTAAYDEVSHMYSGALGPFPQCLRKPPGPGCNARYDAPGKGTIPPNDPDCGPVSLAPWEPLTSCRAKPAAALGGAEQEGSRTRSERRPRSGPGDVAAPPERGQQGPSRSRIVLPNQVRELLDRLTGTRPPVDVPEPDLPRGPGAREAEQLLDFLLGP